MIKINDMVQLFHFTRRAATSGDKSLDTNLLFNLFIFSFCCLLWFAGCHIYMSHFPAAFRVASVVSPIHCFLDFIPTDNGKMENWLIFDVRQCFKCKFANEHMSGSVTQLNPLSTLAEFFSVHFPPCLSPLSSDWLLILYYPPMHLNFLQSWVSSSSPATFFFCPHPSRRINKWIQLFIWKTRPSDRALLIPFRLSFFKSAAKEEKI